MECEARNRGVNFESNIFYFFEHTMSREIDYIQNVTAYATLDKTDEFSIQGGFPTNPDEVVIRQITYGHSAGAGEMLLIHSI